MLYLFKFYSLAHGRQLLSVHLLVFLLTVIRFPCFFALLFVSKNQVDPVMNIVRDIRTFEGFTTFSDEIFGT